MKNTAHLFVLFLLSASQTLYAQSSDSTWTDGLLEPAHFGKAFMSEIHSVIPKVEIGYSKSYSEYNLLEEKTKFERPMVEVHLGIDAPLYAYTFGVEGSTYKWGIAVSLPLSMHVLEDMWDPVSAAVINTDYRFGSARIRAIRNFSDMKYLKNISISWLPVFHECTHLGDEITIYRKDEKFPVTRVNVSYEYTEFQVTVNDPDGSREDLHSLRLGGMYRISNRGLGWYSVREETELTQPLNLKSSSVRHEVYVQYQYQRSTGFMASERFLNVFSAEARDRLRYGIPMYKKVDELWETTEVTEKMSWNFNLYYGWKFYPKKATDQSIGLYFHFYRGLNPYGQLRNYPGFTFIGLSLAYEQ